LNEGQLTVIDEERSIEDVKRQVDKVHSLMKSLMKEGEHYGTIPGTDKPTLLLPGAEILCFTFRLAPEYEVDTIDLPGGHREYRVKTILRNMATGNQVGQGVGSCSTMESKYRWRKSYTQTEAGPLPKKYWDIPKDSADAYKKQQDFLRAEFGPGKYRVQKKDEGWKVFRVEGDEGRAENPDPADQYNTALKMAKKRSLIDSTKTTLATSDLFTQDVEDFAEEPPMRRVDNEDPVPFNLKPEAPAASVLDLRAKLGKLSVDPMLIEDGKAKIAAMLAKPEATADELAELVERTERFLEKVKGKKGGKA
jgi:hypothetical protein